MILVLDYGSQTSQELTRKIRELGVYSELRLPSLTNDQIKELNPKGIILSGVQADETEDVFKLGIPILAIESDSEESLLKNFLFDTCDCKEDGSAANYGEHEVTRSREVEVRRRMMR